ncbi:uncharacterized protein LOC110022465 [Phalaenopsis equestris]|uniref:uncharacterized protein LOC110022465 n=1 Tax=Phalaenopsis equestris TaxID=78828 RepID=UPI0009E287A2|nr:uncharacterized protein LOC110022465 [Phalaenopsis equestris]XP_020577079.1 uncharacterized protein LOC110022465 [Phalaenopsis equestris]
MEGLIVSDANLTIYIHPSMFKSIRGAILSQLSSLLFKYDEVFEGVPLAYQVDGLSRTARILRGLIPYVEVKVRASLLLFSPKPDMLIEGKVVKLGRESVHATVLGFSSAAIMLEDIRGEFKYKTRDGVATFTSRYHKHHSIKVGSIIRFTVKGMDEEMLHISGSLVPPNTGCIHWLSKHEVYEAPQKERSIKRNHMDSADDNVLEQNPSSFQSSERSRPHKSRKRMTQ